MVATRKQQTSLERRLGTFDKLKSCRLDSYTLDIYESRRNLGKKSRDDICSEGGREEREKKDD